jgi:hypothetical protein
MHQGKYVFSQIMSFFPRYEFDVFVNEFDGDKGIRKFSCWQQFLCLAFGQLSSRDSLRDIVICLNAQRKKLYHQGFIYGVSKSTFSDANNSRDWRIYAKLAQLLMKRVHNEYSEDKEFSRHFDFTVFALDSSLIRLCLNAFIWAKYRHCKAGLKVHTLLDVQTSIPYYFHITDGIINDMSVLKQLSFIPGAYYVLDRGYNDFLELYRLHNSKAFFVIRAKRPLRFKRKYSKPKTKNIIFDQVGEFITYDSRKDYPDNIRCIKSRDPNTNSTIVILTNSFELDATDIADLYRNRWKIELFFKWIKQHLKIKAFWGLSENAVKTQIYSALSTYLIVAMIKKKLNLQQNLYEILQILSISLLSKVPINELFENDELQYGDVMAHNQLTLW